MIIQKLPAGEARKKQCFQSAENMCVADGCMGWVWSNEPKLKAYTTLVDLSRKYEGMGEGEQRPRFQMSDFKKPGNLKSGWTFTGIDTDEDGWYASWERETDNERVGFCSLAAQPLIYKKLESIAEELGGIGGAIYDTESR